MCAKSDIAERVNRRERRFQRQRKEIMDAAARLFAEKGYAATSTKDIAEAADLGESTLYGYFASKHEILRAILLDLIEKVDAYLQNVMPVKNRAEIMEMTDGLAEILLENSVYLRAFVSEVMVNDQALDEFVIRRFKDFTLHIRELIEQRNRRADFAQIDPVVGSRVMISSFVMAFLPYLRGIEPSPTPDKRREIAEAVVNILMDGVAARHKPQSTPGETE